ncbi:hypothetical protein [Tenacibaculum sp. 190524A02b]|uniref:hypothetical protein n=1 Tax=Tenacibaculum vairaonense TaxID=3137860 RepID=UPI0031FB2437
MQVLKVEYNKIRQSLLPSFSVKKGEVCGVFISNDVNVELIETELIKTVTQRKIKNKITILSPFYEVKDVYRKQSFWDFITKNNLVRNYVKKQLECDESKVMDILKKCDIGYDWDMNLYGSTRRILSTLIAMEKNENIIYNTFAIDVKGARRLNDVVREKVSQTKGCAIEINYGFSSESMVPLENYNRVVEIITV